MDPISSEHLHAAASHACGGLTDFGPGDYLPGLNALIAATETSPHAGDALRAEVFATSVNALAGRLASEHGWQQRPEALSAAVPAPVIVIGLPRSGTTALHQLLAADPQFQWIPAWIAGRPRVRPARRRWDDDPLYRADVEQYLTQGPNVLHDVGPSDPEECLRVMLQSFVSMKWVSLLPLPDYHEWFLTQDETNSYRRYRDNLRLIGADTPHQPWLLKNPSHTFGLAALLKVFPDARIVHIYRDPVETIVSGASLVAATSNGSDGAFTPRELGAHRLRIWSLAAERMDAARSDRPADQFLDVDYRAFVTDPLAAVDRIYAHFEIPLATAARAAMRQHTTERPQGRHGQHVYSADDFGLTPDAIRERMSGYIKRYPIS